MSNQEPQLISDSDLNALQHSGDVFNPSKAESFAGDRIITIGKVPEDQTSMIFQAAAQLWIITPGSYPLPTEEVRDCTAVRFAGNLISQTPFQHATLSVFQLSGSIGGSHVIIISFDDDEDNNRAIYCNSFNSTCFILGQYGIEFSNLFRRNVLEHDQVLFTNLNKSLLQGNYIKTDSPTIDLNWQSDIYPTLYVNAVSHTRSEDHGFAQFEGRIIGVGTFSTKVLTSDLNDQLIRPDLAYLHNIIQIEVNETSAFPFLANSITSNEHFVSLISSMREHGKKEFEFSTFNMDFFAVHVKLEIENAIPKIKTFILASDMTALENYLYHGFNPDALGLELPLTVN